jgi:hypothetical protein
MTDKQLNVAKLFITERDGMALLPIMGRVFAAPDTPHRCVAFSVQCGADEPTPTPPPPTEPPPTLPPPTEEPVLSPLIPALVSNNSASPIIISGLVSGDLSAVLNDTYKAFTVTDLLGIGWSIQGQ